MAGYTRADVTDQIANGNTVDAVPLDGEFDAIQGAFAAVGGHRHNGTVGEGAPITVIGPTQDVVASANSLTPKTDNAIDLGSSSFEWKDLYIDGTANIDSLVADTADINGGTIDGAVIGGSSPAAITATSVAATSVTIGGDTATTNTATQTLTNKTINLANNTLVATSAQLAASVSDETGSGALVFASSPALTGVPTAPTAVADTNTTQIATAAHVFAERSNTATLTNKTLTSPIINTPVINTPTITGGSVSGITDLAIADGGTGASDAPTALINLGLTATAAELNTLDGITASTAELNILDGVTASTAELNILDGVTATTTELNYVDGVTSAIQTQLDTKYDSGDLATQAAAQAGTNNTTLMTPLRTAEAIAALAPAPTTSSVLAATAGASAGAVGTYVFAAGVLGIGADTSDYGLGATRAGSTLQPASAAYSVGTTGQTLQRGSALSGTWRCMGYYDYQASNVYGATLWLRIS